MKEDEFNFPTTMYGANKLYCEHLGRYYARHYKQLAAETLSGKVDFRCIRFPGLISAETVPSGGTSDYAPEMIHAAAAGKPYACFVRPDTRIPFMAMPDAVDAIFRLMDAPREADAHRLQHRRLRPDRRGGRGGGAGRVPARRRSGRRWTRSGRGSSIRGRPTWTTPPPGAIGATLPAYDFRSAFGDYLIPTIQKRYART